MPETGHNRTISLINQPSKALLQILLSRTKLLVKLILNQMQAGFQEGKGTAEEICNRLLDEKYTEHEQYIYHNFIDFKKVFDRVWHEALRFIMLNTTSVQTLWMYSGHSMSMPKAQSLQTTSVGFGQGCVLSPTLFNLFLEQIMTEAPKTSEGGGNIGGQ